MGTLPTEIGRGELGGGGGGGDEGVGVVVVVVVMVVESVSHSPAV